jgi:hypothetical protein
MNQDMFESMRLELEVLRDMAQSGSMRESHVWPVLDQASKMLDAACGTSGEPTMRIIYSLLLTVWTNTRAMDELRQLAA